MSFALWHLGVKRNDPRPLDSSAFAVSVPSTGPPAVAAEASLTARVASAAMPVAAGEWVVPRG